MIFPDHQHDAASRCFADPGADGSGDGELFGLWRGLLLVVGVRLGVRAGFGFAGGDELVGNGFDLRLIARLRRGSRGGPATNADAGECHRQ